MFTLLLYMAWMWNPAIPYWEQSTDLAMHSMLIGFASKPNWISQQIALQPIIHILPDP